MIVIFDPDTTEADTRANLITPVLLERGWDAGLIFREQKTEPEIEIDESGAGRRGRRRVDYVMLAKFPAGAEPLPVALIEAKKSTAHPGAGLEQAKSYAENARFNNVRFVYSSNGHQFVEFDRDIGKISAPMPMAAFPTPADLLARYQRAAGVWLQSDSAKPLLTEYKTGDSKPRYYQDAAIRAVLEKLARDESASQAAARFAFVGDGRGQNICCGQYAWKNRSRGGDCGARCFCAIATSCANRRAPRFAAFSATPPSPPKNRAGATKPPTRGYTSPLIRRSDWTRRATPLF